MTCIGSHISFQEENNSVPQYCHIVETVFISYMLCTEFNRRVQMKYAYRSHWAFNDPKWTILLQNECPKAVHKRQ